MEIITITCKGEGNWKRDMKIKVENDSKVLSFVSPDEQRHRDWPRKRLTLEEWDNLETFVHNKNIHQLLIVEWNSLEKSEKWRLWKELSPIFKGFRYDKKPTLTKEHLKKLQSLLHTYPQIYHIRYPKNESTIMHQASSHDQEKILATLFESNKEKATVLLNRGLIYGTKPIHNTFLRGDKRECKKARKFLLDRIHDEILKEGNEPNYYLHWEEKNDELRKTINKKLVQEYESLLKRKISGDKHEGPELKRANVHSTEVSPLLLNS
eukprot:m.100976 g.100976  ORF g.100976 m.100976 type:complete len:266 (+) comp13731_c0_seq5:167-964(+)